MTDVKLASLEKQNESLKSQLKIAHTIIEESNLENAKNGEEIDISLIWRAVWSRKLMVISIGALFSIASVVLALALPNEYKAKALLSPAFNSGASSLSQLASQFGGIASLAGIDLGGAGEDSKTTVAIEIIQTWDFIEKFIYANNIEVEVFAANGWDMKSNQILIDEDIYNVETKQWVRDFDPDKGETAEPSSWELYEAFMERLLISKNKDTGLISLSIEYYSPEIAKQWVDQLVIAINEHMQQRDREESITNINYLQAKIEETNLAEMRTVFSQLIEEQTKTLMLAEVSSEYVFKTLSEAKVPEEKSKPERFVIVFMGSIFGGIFAVALALFLQIIRD